MTGPVLARGLGRSYSDVCLNKRGTLILTSRMDEILAFDADRGMLRCEAGVTLDTVVRHCGARGWIPPVMPGTRFVTIGGAIANDVHGKNHPSRGSFGHHVRSLQLLRSDGSRHHVSRVSDCELFAATLGGLGLTGLIVEAELQLEPLPASEFLVTAKPVRYPSDLARLFATPVDGATSKVVWLDGLAAPTELGVGVGLIGVPAEPGSPLGPPPRRWLRPWMFSMISPLFTERLVALHNRYYRWRWERKQSPLQQDIYAFLFPLDAHAGWPRLYGAEGFLQYQCRFPAETSQEGLERLLSLLAASQLRPYLLVVKQFGSREPDGILSFPREGWTVAMDFPLRDNGLPGLLQRMDRIVVELGGSLYPAKDPRMSATLFRHSFPRLEEFRRHLDPKFASDFWRRVGESNSDGGPR